jgi:hypothetical protein
MLGRLIFLKGKCSVEATVLLNYNRLMKRPALFRSLTGLEVSEFDLIYAQVNANYKTTKNKDSKERAENTK